MSANLKLNKHDRNLYIPLPFPDYENDAHFDTGAIKSAMSEKELRRVITAYPSALLKKLPEHEYKNQIDIVPIRKEVQI